ncbi:FkbM family methyltransferase [Dactylosporangium sp. NPDC051541]|uniref:FkbM family methyltransferase n=1 Tax=Dactylosporangium sp. NPDC051541 TaxID=3363977 RepID=UPI0037B7A6C9
MKLFLDVGAHHGQTADIALDPRWGFDTVHAFEPASSCQNILRGYRHRRLHIHKFALSNRSGRTALFGAGLLGASVYADKRRLDPAGAGLEDIDLRSAAAWFLSHLSPDDDIYLKLNCAGSECDVLEDLLDAGLAGWVRAVYVDFDVRGIPSQAHRQAAIEERLRAAGVRYSTPADTPGVAAWLERHCVRSRLGLTAVRYHLGLHRPLYAWQRSIAHATLPPPLFRWAATRFGAMSRTR